MIQLLILLVYGTFAEYAVHRWIMHKRIGGSYWEEHAIFHHAHSRYDINIIMPPHQVFFAQVPLLPLCYFFGANFFVLILCISVFYGYLWTIIHTCHHDLGYEFLHNVPGYSILRKHHLVHHDHVNCNFGTIFIWSDWIFGTNYKGK